MKLIRAVERLEGAAKRKRRVPAAGTAWGVLWSEGEELLGRELEPGEYLVRDLHVLDGFQNVRRVRSKERATKEAGDYGAMYDTEGRVVARVDGSDGLMVSVSPEPGEIEFWGSRAGLARKKRGAA